MKRLGVDSPERLEGYNSPFILLMGIALLLLFANMKLPTWLAKTATFLAPASFGVYLIHLHPSVRNNLLLDAFIGAARFPAWALVPVTIALAAGIYVLCAGIDLLRHYLFKVLKVKPRLSNLEKKLFPNHGGNE